MTDTSKEAVLKVDQNLQHEPDVKEGYLIDISPVRFKPYKPAGQRQMKRKGRWQRMNEYAGWENCPETPAEIWAEFPDFRALLSERDALRAQLQAARDALQWYANTVKDCNRYGSEGDRARALLAEDVGDSAIRALKSTSTEGEG
ncbi:hypothetical protein VWZ40_00900 [Phaeobacter sp. JH20_21]|uniref:hypothetical protein n=1 Tax=unclassified Phaeobacter TaxID=2621772 RepID=UPI003A866E73